MMADQTKDEKAAASSSNVDSTLKVDVHLDTAVDANTAAEYLSLISSFRMNADIIEIMNVAEDGCTAVVTCRSRCLAEELISAINNTTSETGVTAEMEGTLEKRSRTVERAWEEMCQKGTEKIELHDKKVEEVKSRIQQIVAGNKKRKGVEMNEFFRQQALMKPLQEKLKELELQKDEFCGYIDGLQSRLETSAQNLNWDASVTQCRTAFELELGRFERSLPMYARKSDVLQTIINNKVCVILGETGSGKSTQILQYIHEAGFHEGGFVVCTQPRKVAAVSLARRVSEEMGNQPGLVGSKVGAQSYRNRDAKLLYITDHLLLNEGLKDPLLSKYSVIIVDEAHERSIYSDLLLGFLKLALPKRSDLHVVIMSATINPDLFVSYFSDAVESKPPVLQVSGRAFPVDVSYEESSEDYMKAAYLKALDIHRNEPSGDILVFLTSPIETEKACKNLMSQCGKDAATIQALELHGRLQIEDQQKIFNPTPNGMRKIVFATNSAETSVTIPGIKYVIDTGRVKELSYDAKRNISSLNVQWVTKSSAEQRKGRAGRTDCGKCYRLYSEEEFSKMREQSVPEILRIHLGQAMLKLMTLGISNPMDFDFVEAPPRDAVEGALSVLQDLGAYDENGITEVGKKLAKISLEPRLGKVVLIGIERGIPLESAVMASVCTVGGSIFFRGGTEEQKQQADRKKTRFCDEWGDIVTLVNVYKEWITIPEKNRSKWCVENSINAKSMRAARDTLAEIRQTFKLELSIVIPTSDFTETELANEKMARILYECYFSNLSRFSGHEREGFFLANLPSVVMHVHPSCALTYIEELPRWVVYEQVLTTSKTFLLNATFVKEEWIQEWICNGKLRLSLDFLSLFVLRPLPVQHIGSQCIRNLLSNKAESKKQIEAEVKNEAEDARCYIDIVSLEGRTGGTLTLYSTPSSEKMATFRLQSRLRDVRKSLGDECIEDLLLPNSRVRFVLDKGGEIRTILMPSESRAVKVMLSSDLQLTEATVRRKLSQFGDIEKIRTDAKDGVWGIVTFKLPGHAENALISKDPSSTFKLESCAYTAASRENSEKFDYTVKVVAARRLLRGFGFVQFENDTDASYVVNVLCLHSFIITKECGQGGILDSVVKMEVDRKTFTQLYLKSVPLWANENIVRTGLDRAIKNRDVQVKIANLFLPRENVPRDSQLQLNQFRQMLKDKLLDSGITETDYRAAVPTPHEKHYNFVAYLNFQDSVKARRSSDLLNSARFNECFVDACLLLKISFFVPLAVNKFCAGQLQNKNASVQKAAEGDVNVQSKMCRSSVVTTVQATCLEDLVMTRERLAPLLSGRKVEMNRQQMSFVKSEAGIKQVRKLESEMRVKTYVDDRQGAVLIYSGTSDVAAEAEQRLSELMSATMPEVSKDVSLRDVEYPKGLMKALVVEYGPNLEQLKENSGMSSLDLILRQHKLRTQGSNEAYKKLMDLISEKAKEIIERRPVSAECPDAVSSSRLPACPICLDSVDPNECYVMEYCSHVYCRGCATDLVDNAVKGNQIPIRCCFENCDEPLVIQDFRSLFEGNLERLYDTAVRSFMMANGDSYSHCITPECKMIYRRAPPGRSGEEFHCSECQVTLCTACNEVAHPGVLRCIKDREEVSKWVKSNPSNRCACPKCGVGIEKDGGCNHMECTACHIHFCWHCPKERFDDSQSCYAHLAKFHGGFY